MRTKPQSPHSRFSQLVLTAVFATLWLGACAGTSGPRWDELAPVPRPMVDALDEDTLRIRWPASFTLGSVDVFEGPAPDRIDLSKPIAHARPLFTKVVVHGYERRERPFFELVAADGAKTRIVAERRLPLEGTDNFRDIGGYATQDGHFVRWGLLYRSNNLSNLTASDVRYLDGIGVKLVCDFRSAPERRRDPNRAPDTASTAELSIDVEGVDPEALQKRIRTGVHAEQLEQIMLNAYRSFVTQHSDQFAAMFDRILDDRNLPTIVHCTAGKDRTGFASAMILWALGVPEETIYEDYMATNRYRAGYKRWITRLVPIYSMFRTKGSDLEPLLDARRPYLKASFDTIEAEYGTVDNYLEKGLGVSPEEREHLRQTFLR